MPAAVPQLQSDLARIDPHDVTYSFPLMLGTALNATVLLASTFKGFPVFGLRPYRAARFFTVKVSNPGLTNIGCSNRG